MGSARDPALGDELDAALAEASWLRRLARSLVRDPHRAEDAAQETWLAALEHGAPRSARAWLATVLRNRVRQDARGALRRERHEHAAPHARAMPAPDELNARLELQGLLLEAVRGLEEPYRSTLVARFFDELPPRAIARRDGVPVKTVNTRLERGLAKLRARLDGRFGGERGAWLSALLPWASAGGREAWIGGLGMGVKTKAAVGVAAALGALWLGRTLLTETRTTERTRAEGQSELVGEARASETSEGASVTELGASDGSALASSASNAARTTAEPNAAEPAGSRASAALTVRALKRRTNEALRHGQIEVRDAAPASENAELLEGQAKVLAHAALDASGRVTLRVPTGCALWVALDPGEWETVANGSANEVEPLQRTRVRVEPLAAGEARELTLEIEHGNDLVFEGRVVAAEDERPLSGASIRRLDDAPGEPLASDAQGDFALPYASWAPPRSLEVAHEGYTAVRLRPQWLDQTPGVPRVIALERESFVVARVSGGGGRTDLELRARDAELGDLHATLDEHGRAELGVPARHPLALELRSGQGEALWSSAEPWTLEPGEHRELALTLDAGTLVLGTLRDARGNALAGRELWALPAPAGEAIEGETRYVEGEQANPLVTKTDAGGRFEFPALHSGPWWLGPPPHDDQERPAGDPDALASSFVGIELHPGEATRRVDLVAHRGLWIEGRVEDEDHHRLPGAYLQVAPPGKSESFSLGADGDGEFRLGPLAPGDYELRVLGADGVFGWPRESQTVAAGRTDVVLVLSLANSIGGRVVDGEGRAQDTQAHLLQRNGSLGQGTSSQAQGAFRFVALQPGVYSVQAEAPDGRVAVRSVTLEDGKRVSDVVLTIAEGARIGVSHALDHNVRCAIFADGVLAADSTVSPGEENFETVPAGRLRVELYSGSEIVAVRELVGRAGHVETVRFE